jgi:hypothetical protein
MVGFLKIRGFIMSNGLNEIKRIKNLSDLERIALLKCVNPRGVNNEEVLPPGSSEEVNFVVAIDGLISRGPKGAPRRGTNRALTSLAVIATLTKMGFIRDHIPAILVETWANFGGMTKKELEGYRDSLDPQSKALFEDCEQLFEEKVVYQLPKIEQKGYLKFYPND